MKRLLQAALIGTAILVCYELLSASMPPVPSGTWALLQNGMQQARKGASVVQLQDGRLLVIGGESATGAQATAETLDANGAFHAVASMSVARANHASVVLADGRVL